ncbi:hypothetical protein [Vreelandella olivaria]|uniref:hypothetical protein n=1 Tax=Vreelandella olivaria TaxID=390919 RepID=UPI00201F6A0C|nr:hypothetical protein [Halomonas olivaria]
MGKINIFRFKFLCFVTYYTLLSMASFAVLLSFYQEFFGSTGDGRAVFISGLMLILLCIIVKKDMRESGFFNSSDDF